MKGNPNNDVTTLPNKPIPASPSNKKIDVEKAIELRLKGVSFADIGKHFGASKQAAIQCLKPYVQTADIDVEIYKKKRADLIAAKGATVLGAITEKKLKEAGAKDLAIVFGTLYDKERLERGQSTQNTAVLMASAVLEADRQEAETLASKRSSVTPSVTPADDRVIDVSSNKDLD